MKKKPIFILFLLTLSLVLTGGSYNWVSPNLNFVSPLYQVGIDVYLNATDLNMTINGSLGDYLRNDGDTATGNYIFNSSIFRIKGGVLTVDSQGGTADYITLNELSTVMTRSNSGAGYSLITDGSYAGAGGYLDFRPKGIYAMRIAYDGKVGIGTTTPTYALDVVGDIGLDDRIYHNGDVDTYIYMLPDRMLYYAGAEALMDLYEGGQDYVKIGDGGDVDINLNNNVYVKGSNSMMGVATSSPTSYLHTGRSFATGVICTNKAITLTASHCVVLVDASREAITITLPSVSEINGRWYMIKKIDSSENAVIIDGSDSETIDGALTYSLSRQWNAKTIVSYFSMGTSGWYINDR